MRRFFIFNKKKCRIYAAFGVSQTPSNLEITKGEAEIFIISGSNEPKTLIKTTGTYENTITLPDGSNYIGIVGNDFSGTVKIEVK